jgi:hypothetical protein
MLSGLLFAFDGEATFFGPIFGMGWIEALTVYHILVNIEIILDLAPALTP